MEIVIRAMVVYLLLFLLMRGNQEAGPGRDVPCSR